MPDATELLSKDHRHVEELFGRYRDTKDPSVVEEICTELSLHAAIEEQVLYPVLGNEVDESMRHHSQEEHEEVKDAILTIQRLGYDDPEVDEHVRMIMDDVADHVQEEEGEIFPKMRDVLGDERLARLGDELVRAKEEKSAEAEKAGPLIDLTVEELYDLARERGIEGRSDMSKEELLSALRAG